MTAGLCFRPEPMEVVQRGAGPYEGDHRSDEHSADNMLAADVIEGYRVCDQLARQRSIADAFLVLLLVVPGVGVRWWATH